MSDLNTKGYISTINRFSIQLFVLCCILYPMLSGQSRVILIIIFLFMTLKFFLREKIFIKKNIYLLSFVSINLFIYLFGLITGIVNGNDITMVFLDSAGFPFYFVFLPICLYIINDIYALEFFKKTFINYSLVFASISIIIFVGFYSTLGVLNLDTITVANSFISNYINLKLGATNELLRVNTNSVQVLFLALFILLNKNSNLKFDRFSVLIFFIAILVDGHRAAIIVFLLMYIAYIILYKPLFYWILIAFLSIPILIINSNEVLERADFSTKSTSDRIEQIGPLVDKISESMILGSGFGTNASLIRNETRPFMYEMDTLAITMKLGIPLAIAYTFLWFLLINGSQKVNLKSKRFLFSIITMFCCMFYMSTNGGFYMSPLTTILQFLLFLSFYSYNRHKKSNYKCRTYRLVQKKPNYVRDREGAQNKNLSL